MRRSEEILTLFIDSAEYVSRIVDLRIDLDVVCPIKPVITKMVQMSKRIWVYFCFMIINPIIFIEALIYKCMSPTHSFMSLKEIFFS